MQRSSMAKIPAKAIEEYQRVLQRDPASKVFAPLAEALRESGDFQKAEMVAGDGVRRHPQYVGGFVVLGRILLDQGRLREALPILKKASELDPENLLALQLLGTLYLQTNQAKDALKSFKRVLFLNPQSEKAQNAVQKLESLSAEDYDEDVFQYQTLKPSSAGALQKEKQPPQRPSSAPQAQSSNPNLQFEIDRKLSLIDALIVRNDLERARQVLMELHAKAPSHPEISKRFDLLDEALPEEEAVLLHPLVSREKMVVEKKKRILENLLQRIKEHNESQIFDSTNGSFS